MVPLGISVRLSGGLVAPDKRNLSVSLARQCNTFSFVVVNAVHDDLVPFHLDSSSFHVHGEYASNRDEAKGESTAIEITYGYSRDHRPDLKQFIVDLMCTRDGDIPL